MGPSQHSIHSGTGEFVSERLCPVEGSGRVGPKAPGEPALPGEFTWRGARWVSMDVLRKWKRSGPCRNGSAERYLRRHYYQVRVLRQEQTDPAGETTTEHAPSREELILTIYFERQPRAGQSPRARWYVYTIDSNPAAPAG